MMVQEGNFTIYCKKLGKQIKVDHEVTSCPECGAQLVNVGFALVE